MSYLFDTQPILEVMRRKTEATVESIKAAIAQRKAPEPRRSLQFTIQCMGTTVKHGGSFGHKNR